MLNFNKHEIHKTNSTNLNELIMKCVKSIFILVLMISLAGCQNAKKKTDQESTPSKEQKEISTSDAPKTKKLTTDVQARNIFKNTLSIFSGTMVLAYNSTFQQSAESLAKTFSSGSVKEMDEDIANLEANLIEELDNVKTEMDKAFDEMKSTNEKAYKKLFTHEVMKEGIEITKKHDLPDGYPPLSSNLSQDEMKRYIVKITTASNDAEDPVIKMYTELMQWFQKVSEELNKDAEIKQMLESMKK